MTWEEKYQLAVNFYNHYHHLDMPGKFRTFDGINYDENGEYLGAWIKANKYCRSGNPNFQYIKLNEKKIQALDKIGMIWENAKGIGWNEYYNLAIQYYNHYGHLEMPALFKTFDGINEDEKGYKLGVWIQNNRSHFKKGILKEDRKILLDNIGMVWSVDQIRWNLMYDLACKYYEHNHHLNVPISFKTLDGFNYSENGYSLGTWVQTQKTRNNDNYQYSRITDEQKSKLEKLGIIWNISDTSWEEIYLLAEKYFNHYKNLNVPNNFKTKDGIHYDNDGVNLGNWICTNRSVIFRRNESKTYQYRKDKLDKIGMIWNLQDAQWDFMFSLAERHFSYYGDLDIPYSFNTFDGIIKEEDGYRLGDWISNQRVLFKDKKDKYRGLNQERVDKLNSINMIWDANEYKWNKMYGLVKEYFNYYGNVKLPIGFRTTDGINYDENGEELYNWFKRQKSYFKDDICDDLDKKQRLADIGVVWNTSKNKQEVLNFINNINVKIKSYDKTLLLRQSIRELNAKSEFLKNNGLSIIEGKRLNEIFFMSGKNIEAKYGISLDLLMKQYENKLEK